MIHILGRPIILLIYNHFMYTFRVEVRDVMQENV